MFEGQVDCPKRLNKLYDEVQRHYHVIAKLTCAMAKEYVFKGCRKACKRDIAHVCDKTFSDCMVSLPCAFAVVPIPCDDCHRHIRKAFELHFILNRVMLLKWKPDLIMNGQNFMCIKREYLVFLDSVSFLPFPLRSLPKAFGLTVAKSCYPHYFNVEENLDY